MNYITVLDFESGRVFQYDLKNSNYEENKNMEEFLTNKGHNSNNCEWMQHENPQIITN